VKSVYIPFKVAAISSNKNTFGLNQGIAVAKDGTAYKIHFADWTGITRHRTLNIRRNTFGRLEWSMHGIEAPELTVRAPRRVVREVWG